jgi:hypothetical protein
VEIGGSISPFSLIPFLVLVRHSVSAQLA